MISLESLSNPKILAILSVIIGTICILITYEIPASLLEVILSFFKIDIKSFIDKINKNAIRKRNARIFGHLMILLGILVLAYFVCYTCENLKPTISEFSPNMSSPQEAGVTIEWTAKASDPENDPIEFKFFLNGEPVTKWQSQGQWIWKTDDSYEGDNKIEVWIRDGKHADENCYDDNETARFIIHDNEKPKISEFSPDKSSPREVGETINWTTEASDPENDSIEYKFFRNGKPVREEWQSMSYWVWEPDSKGDNEIEVWIRDGKHADKSGHDDSRSDSFEIKVPLNQVPTISEFSPDKSSPQAVGETITWTAEASDTEDPISYKFLLNGRAVTEWQSKSHWVWKPDDSNKGDNKIEVWIRDGKHADESSYDDSRSYSFEIKDPNNQEPTISRFSPDKSSPQEVGETITWTAEATDTEDPISYKFLLNGRAVTEWQSKSHWVWEPDDSNKGDNKIEVWIRDGKHAGENSYDDSETDRFIINEIPVPSPEISYQFSRNGNWLTAPNEPKTGELVELKLEPIPSGNIIKYQWTSSLETPVLIGDVGDGKESIHYAFKRDGPHKIEVEVKYKDRDTDRYKLSLNVIPQ